MHADILRCAFSCFFAGDIISKLIPKNGNGELVVGRRRVEACKAAGWTRIPVIINNTIDRYRALHDENIHRKDLTKEEQVYLGRIIAKDMRHQARKAQSTKVPFGRTRDKTAAQLGMSGKTLEKADTIIKARDDNPKDEKIQTFVEKMNKTGKVHQTFKKLKTHLAGKEAIKTTPAQTKIGVNQIICGDALATLKKLESHSVHAIITDPTWGMGFSYGDWQEPINRDPIAYWAFLQPIWEEMKRIIKPRHPIFICQSTEYMPYYHQWFGSGLGFYALCNQSFAANKNQYLTRNWVMGIYTFLGQEYIKTQQGLPHDFFVTKQALPSIVRNHPCARADDMCDNLIQQFCIKGGVVLDPFNGIGSFTTAAKRCGRQYIGIEQSADYCAIAQSRIAELESAVA